MFAASPLPLPAPVAENAAPMRRTSLALLLAPLGFLTVDTAFAAKAANAPLLKLFDTTWQEDLADDPLSATQLGDPRYNDRWPGHVAGGHRPPPEEELRAPAVAGQDQPRQARQGRPAQLRPVPARHQDAHRGIPVQAVDVRHRAPSMVRSCWPRSPSSRRSTRSRTTTTGSRASTPTGVYVDQWILLLTQGTTERLTQPRVTINKVLEQLKGPLTADPEANPFYAPFKKMPASIPAAEQARLTAAGKAAVQVVAIPAFQRFDKFFREVYLPASRDTVGIYDIAGRRAVLPQPHPLLHHGRQPGCGAHPQPRPRGSEAHPRARWRRRSRASTSSARSTSSWDSCAPIRASSTRRRKN